MKRFGMLEYANTWAVYQLPLFSADKLVSGAELESVRCFSLRDYWATWEPTEIAGQNVEQEMDLSAYVVWAFSKLRVCPFKNRCELHLSKVLKK